MPYRLAPCDLGDPGWGDPWFPHGAFVELAHELAPVTPRFCGFVLCCCVLFCVGGFAFGWCLVLFGGDFVTAYWTALRSCTSSLLRPLNQRTAMCMR